MLVFPECKIKKKTIKKNMAWCDDPKLMKRYNEEIKIHNTKQKEKLYRVRL